MKETNYEKLEKGQKKLVDEAEKAMKNAYCPYSKMGVGAALLTDEGEVIKGANVESVVNSNSVCAERSAVLEATNRGFRNFKAIAIIASGPGLKSKEPIPPCGDCRQMLYEASTMSGNDIEVIMVSTDKRKVIVSSVKELMPLPFGPHYLEE